MQFKQYYRPKLPRNKYSSITKNHLSQITGSVSTYAMRAPQQEIIHLDMVRPLTVLEEQMEIDSEIIIETETPPETEI